LNFKDHIFQLCKKRSKQKLQSELQKLVTIGLILLSNIIVVI